MQERLLPARYYEPSADEHERTINASPHVDRRRSGRELFGQAEELASALHEAHVLGDELLERFERIDMARRALEPLGLLTAVEFCEPVQAALRKWRAESRSVFDLPAFMCGEPE